MSNELMNVTKDAAKEIGKNIKIDVALSGTSAAVCVSIISVCAAGVISFGICAWHDIQKEKVA